MTDPFDFSGRSALVTGAASGIGAALARWLAQHGIGTLHLVDVNGEALDSLELDCQVVRHQADVADPEFWARFERETGRLDHAAINAGIGKGGSLLEMELADWRSVMAINLDGAFLSLQAAMRLMRESGGGSAVITSSITGIKAHANLGAYGVSKAAVAHMAKIAALDGAPHKIRVNAIAPGGVDTAIWDAGEEFRKAAAEHGREAAIAAMGGSSPRGKFATADELAGDIGYLLSDLAANVTGTVMVSDGGYGL